MLRGEIERLAVQRGDFQLGNSGRSGNSSYKATPSA